MMSEPPHVVVVHHDLEKRGGGEAVCLAVCAALEREFDVTLLLSSSCHDIDGVCEYFNTSLEQTSIEVATVGGVELGRLMRWVDTLTVSKLDYFSRGIQGALFNRHMSDALPECDLVICTWNELATDQPGVQYIHYPIRFQLLERSTTDNRLFKTIADLFDERIQTFSRFDPALFENDTVLVNSGWTAKKVRNRYSIEPKVLNPPIDTEPFQDHVSWNERENGFVFLSRISPEKNVLWLIEIVIELRERGHDIHFHIVGPKDTDFPEYYDEVESAVAVNDFIHLEGELWGRELVSLLCSHRYGINGATTEQFGIAIGEMIAAGMIPFVPNSGGQTQLVGENDALLFETTDAAVEKISSVLADDDHRRTVQNALPDIEQCYGKAKFQQEIVEIVTERLTE